MALRVRISAMPSVTLMYGCHCHCAQFSLSACGGIFGRTGFVVVVVVIVLSVCSGISDVVIRASAIHRASLFLLVVAYLDIRGVVVVVTEIVLSVCSGISDADVWASDIQRRLQHLPDVPQGDPRDTAENETGGNR